GFRLVANPPYAGSSVLSLTEDASGTLWAVRDGDPTQPNQSLVWQLVGDRLRPRKDLDRWWLVEEGPGKGAARTTGDGWATPPPGMGNFFLSRDLAGAVWGQLTLGRLV